MTTSSRTPHSAKRRRLQCVVALALTCSLESTQGFSAVTLSEQRVLSSERYFRENRDTKSAGAYMPSDLLGQDFQFQIKQSNSKALLSTATSSQLYEVQSTPTPSPMPLWLSQSKGHLFEENWDALETTLKQSFFSSKEASKLLKAIKRAARGDRNKMAGAVEFCQILVETMETDLNTLIAASFHFCSCVAARENSVAPPTGADSFYSWEHQDQFDMQLSFSDTTAFIAKDASHLKKLELLAVNSDVTTANPADADNLQMLLLTETKDWRALAIRCAACLFRLTGIIRTRPNELTKESIRVAREAFHVYAPLASRLGMHRLKNELEGAAFRVLYRRQYEKVNKLTHEIRPPSSASLSRKGNLDGYSEKLDIGESMKHVLLSVQDEMVHLLEQDPQFSDNVESFSITSRVKEPYSVWKKMIRKGTKHILDVPDALALRVVLDAKRKSQDENPLLTKARERALCYYAQNLCTQHWKPLEENPRFKDYIERPKPNGYQSLHYTAHTEWAGEDWTLEVQVRSGEMHQVAEFGFASHWEYKAEQNNRKVEDRSGGGYLRFLQEWHWRQHAPSVQIEECLKCGEEESAECESKIRADRIRARTKHLEPYLHAFTNAQSDLARERVFVFVFGKLVDLPSGSSIQDALEEADFPVGMPLEFGPSEVSLILHNGLESRIDTVLRNGDSLTTGLQTSTLRP